jgi:hypothetical protein
MARPGTICFWLRVIGINAGLLLGFVVAFELAFGNWFVSYEVPEPRLLDRTLRFQQTLYEPHGEVTYFRDKYGLRTFNNPLSKVELITVGGSTTAQSLLSDGDTFQDVIYKKTGIVIANAGADGMSTQSADSILENWLYLIPELKPKFFLHYVGINDASRTQTVRIQDRQTDYSWNRRIRGRSILYQLWSKLKTRLEGPHVVTHGAVTEGVPRERMVKAVGDRAAIEAYVERFYKSNLGYLIESHRKRAQGVILVTQTANPALVVREGNDSFVGRHYGEWAVSLDRVNEGTRSVCREYRSPARHTTWGYQTRRR